MYLLLNFNIINLIVMGQEASNPNIITQADRGKSQHKKLKKELEKPNLRHEGILKLAQTPFQNCQKIETANQVYFLEQTRTSLKDLIKHKLRLKKCFSEEQVSKLIENLVYALAYLESLNSSYPYLSIENIFLCKNNFKLLPPSVLKSDIYSKLKQCLKQKSRLYVPASPQMIIAVRCQQHTLKEQQILLKSNVFALGLILLQICTLKSSAECYDLETYDILDNVITERIQEIQTIYSKKIVRIIANMIDYDFEERMTPKELSIWVNRQFTQNQDEQIVEQLNKTQKINQNYIVKSRIVQQSQKLQNTKREKQRQQFDPHPTIKTNQQKVSQKRINEIRAKINKQKIAAQMQACQQRDISKSRGKVKKTIINFDKSGKKNLPNPYLNHEYHNKLGEKNQKSRYSPSPYSKRQLGTYDIGKSRTNVNYQQNIRYQYSKLCRQDEPIRNDRQMGLKYKYQINQSQAEQDGGIISSNRKRDTDRFFRVQNIISDYQRSCSGKKYNYNVMEENYEQRQLKKQRNKQRQGLSSERQIKDKESQRFKYSQIERQPISDFSFEPIKQNKQSDKVYLNVSQKQQTRQQFGLRQNVIQNKRDQKQVKLNKSYKQDVKQHPYERHQRLYTNQSKSIKNMQKQNEDIKMIKKQIERSRKIIEQVKKTQCESNYYD